MSSIIGNTPTKESPVCVVPPISNPNTPTKANKVFNAGDGRNTPGHYDGIGACASTTAVFTRPRPPCFANRLAPLKVQVDSNNEGNGNSDGITSAEQALVLFPTGTSMADIPSAIAPPTSPLNRSISVPDLSQVPKAVVLPEHLYNEGDLIQKWLSNLDPKTPTAAAPGLSQLPAFSPTPIRQPPSSPPHHPRVSAILHAGSPRAANNSSGNAYLMSPRTFSKTRLGRSPAPIFTHVQDLQKMINLMFPENERLSKEVDQLKMALSDRETALSKLDEQLHKKDREFEELQLAKERIELEMESATKDRRDEAVRNRLLDAEIKSKNKECEQLQIELDKLIQCEKLLQTKLDLLQADLNASKALVNQLTMNHAEQLRQTSQLQERADEAQGSMKSLTMRMMEMQDTLTQARGDYEAERHRANLNEREATSAHTQVAELREQVAQLSTRLEQLQNERSSLEHTVNLMSVCNSN